MTILLAIITLAALVALAQYARLLLASPILTDEERLFEALLQLARSIPADPR